MPSFNEYPYTNYNDLNLDWIISKLKEFQGTMDEFIRIHPAISYATPIQWNIAYLYEPNKVVLGPNDDTYLSVKEVPAGIQLSNAEYWIKIGLFNAQLSAYRTESKNYTDQEINKVNSPTLKNMARRKFVFVGDSYTQMPTPSTSFVGKVASFLGLQPTQYHNIGVNGVDMSGYITQVNNYSYTDAAEITDVVVTGGINDAHVMSSASTLGTTIPQLLTAITTKFTNAIIWAGWSGGGLYTRLTGTYPGFTYNNVNDIKFKWIQGFSHSPKVIYMDKLDQWARFVADTDVLTGSGLHPNNWGVTVLAEMIANYLKGGDLVSDNLTFHTAVYMPFTIPNTISTFGTSYLNKIGDSTYIDFAGGGANLSPDITINTTEKVFSEWNGTDGLHTYFYSNDDITIGGTIYYTISGSLDLHPIMANFTLSKNQIKFKCPTANTAINNVHSLWIPHLRFVVPANVL